MVMLSGLQVYTEQGVLPAASVLVQDGKIQAISSAVQASAVKTLHFPANYHLIPGFIDMHVHGANGSDVMDATPFALSTISQALAKEGTTSFLATTMTAEVAELEKVLINTHHFMNAPSSQVGAAILGIHLEGPFLAPSKMGAQRGDNIIPPDIKLFQHWQLLSGNTIKLVTIAPELPESLAFIAYLKEQKIIASIGHSNATYAEAMAAIETGSSHATHLFNAMRGIHQREPGIVTAALLADSVMAELIVDGVHLHPAIVEMALKLKGKDKIILVTDAMRAKCLSDGCYDLGGQAVYVKEGQAELADGTLAGSVLPMSSAIKNMLQFTGCELMDAVKMASENPARALGLFDRKGSIALQKDADLVVLDDKLNVVLTICGGQIAYSIQDSMLTSADVTKS